MYAGVLASTERGDLLIMADSVITIRNYVDQEHPDLLDALTIFRPHQMIILPEPEETIN